MRFLRHIYVICILCLAVFSKAQAIQPHPDTIQNRYYSEIKTTTEPLLDTLRKGYVRLYSFNQKVFLTKMDSARGVFLKVLNSYSTKLKPEFVHGQQVQINYYIDKLLMDYPVNYHTYTGQPFPYDSEITQRLKKDYADLDNPKLLNNIAIRNFAHSFFTFQLSYELQKPAYQNIDNRRLVAAFSLIGRYIKNPKCRNFWQYDFLYNHIYNAGIKGISKIYTRFMATCKDSVYSGRISRLYQSDYSGRKGHLIKVYKTVGPYKLDMHIFQPDSAAKGNKWPVMVYFHAGSWIEGKPDWFFGACKADAKRGWLACAVEYRVYDREGTLPFAAVEDARSAVRWLRQHAAEYNIDTARIVVSGYSAGGTLALDCALANKYNAPSDDLRFSATPNAIMVTSAIYDLTDDNNAWVRRDLTDKDLVKDISPEFLVKSTLPPLLVIHGVDDTEAPYRSSKQFEANMVKFGPPPEFHSIKGATHFLWLDPKYSNLVDRIQKAFLKKNGY